MNSILVSISTWILIPLFFLALMAPAILSIIEEFTEQSWRAFVGPLISILLSGIVIYLDLKYGLLHVWNNTGSAILSVWEISLSLIIGLVFTLLLYLYLNRNLFSTILLFVINILIIYIFFSQRNVATYFAQCFPYFTASSVLSLIILILAGRQRHPSPITEYFSGEMPNIRGNLAYNDEGGHQYHHGAGTYDVRFTAFHPKEGSVESWHTLLVYAHTLFTIEIMYNDVEKFGGRINLAKKITAISKTPLAYGTEITVIPSCEGVTFNPERVTLKWEEDFHRADFRFKADQSLSGDAAKGSIEIYVGPLIIGTLKFAMLFNEKDTQPVPDHEESAKMYGKDDVFISYSRKDSEIARTFKTVLEGTGLDVFLDVDDIRSGQLWENELKRRIEQAKIFQIFWSANYSQSENCKQEWEYALKQNKDEGYIRPVFWQKPLTPNPPEELNKFNFKYVELK